MQICIFAGKKIINVVEDETVNNPGSSLSALSPISFSFWFPVQTVVINYFGGLKPSVNTATAI